MLDDLDLPRTEAAERRFRQRTSGGAAEIPAQHQFGHPGSEEQPVLADCFEGRDQVRAGILLEDVAARAGGQDVVHNLVRFVDGENQDLGAGVVLEDLAGGLEAVHIGHGDVHDHHVGLETGGGSHGFAARGCFAAHLPIGPRVPDDSGDAAPYDQMIIHQQYPRFLHWSKPAAELRSESCRHRWRKDPTGHQAARRAPACP